MTQLRVLLSRAVGVLVRAGRDRQLAEEIEDHLARLTDEHLARGLTPEEARAAARRAFGGIDQVRETYRDQSSLPGLALGQDIRFAVRLLSKDRWFTGVAVLALALGIGVTSMMLTIIHAYYFRGLPGADPDRVLYVGTRDRDGRDGGVSLRDYEDWRTAAQSFDGMAAYANATLSISEPDQAPDRVPAAYVTSNLFGLLDERPMLGRDFAPEDDRAGAPRVAILSHRLWTTRYGADRSILGRTIHIDSRPATIVGVMREGFGFPFWQTLWQPLGAMPDVDQTSRGARALGVVAVVRDDVSRARAVLDLETIAARLAQDYPDTNEHVRPTVVRFGQQQVGRLGADAPAPLVLMATAVLVLLIACANVANLLLARSAERAREISIRASVGASRWRIVRQLLVEGVLLASMAGVVGVGLSTFGVSYVSAAFEGNVPYWLVLTVDRRVLAALAGLCLGTTVLFALAPALHLSKADVSALLKEGGRAGISRRVRRTVDALLVAEFALTIILLAAAGLMLRSFLAIHGDDRIIDTSPLVTMRLLLPDQKYSTPEQRVTFYHRLDERLLAIPAISSGTVATVVPFLSAPRRPLEIATDPSGGTSKPLTVPTLTIGAHYFETIGVELLRGRPFSGLDGSPGYEAAIVNERFAALYFRDVDPVGREIRLGAEGATATSPPWLTVIGVSPTIRQASQAAAGPVLYLPLRAAPPAESTLIVRGSSELGAMVAALRSAVAVLDVEVPLFHVRPLDTVLTNSRLQLRLVGSVLAGFAAIALALATVGLYSMTAYAVAQRTQEIGLRMALGARARQVAWLFVRRSFTPLGIGTALGLCGAFAVGQLARGALVRTSPTDPVTLAAIVGLLIVVTMAACVVPARRAARLDPLTALRYE